MESSDSPTREADSNGSRLLENLEILVLTRLENYADF